jgi:hypothetical protein
MLQNECYMTNKHLILKYWQVICRLKTLCKTNDSTASSQCNNYVFPGKSNALSAEWNRISCTIRSVSKDIKQKKFTTHLANTVGNSLNNHLISKVAFKTIKIYAPSNRIYICSRLQPAKHRPSKHSQCQ